MKPKNNNNIVDLNGNGAEDFGLIEVEKGIHKRISNPIKYEYEKSIVSFGTTYPKTGTFYPVTKPEKTREQKITYHIVIPCKDEPFSYLGIVSTGKKRFRIPR